MSRRRFEIAAYGWDPAFQGFASGPDGRALFHGLRIPLATTVSLLKTGDGTSIGSTAQRYLFQLCTYKLAAGQCVNITSIKTGVTIGQDLASPTPPMYPNEYLVSSPLWHFVDGDVIFGLRMIRNPPALEPSGNKLTSNSLAYRWSEAPALIWEVSGFPAANLDAAGNPDNYLSINKYTAPFAGGFPGTALGELGTIRGNFFPYTAGNTAQSIAPIGVEGPGAIVLYASVWQTAPLSRATQPAGFAADPVLQPEESYIGKNTSAQYWRVLGSVGLERCERHEMCEGGVR